MTTICRFLPHRKRQIAWCLFSKTYDIRSSRFVASILDFVYIHTSCGSQIVVGSNIKLVRASCFGLVCAIVAKIGHLLPYPCKGMS